MILTYGFNDDIDCHPGDLMSEGFSRFNPVSLLKKKRVAMFGTILEHILHKPSLDMRKHKNFASMMNGYEWFPFYHLYLHIRFIYCLKKLFWHFLSN